MQDQTTTKGPRHPRPGLAVAAKILGISYGHAYRVLVTKERASRSLWERYEKLKAEQNFNPQSQSPMDNRYLRFQAGQLAAPNTSVSPGGVDAADANYSEDWGQTVGAIGFTVICLKIEAKSGMCSYFDLIERLGEDFHDAGLGHLDSSQWGVPARHLIYADTKRLPEALDFVKARLEQDGLLSISAIGFMDLAEHCWRTFWTCVAPI